MTRIGQNLAGVINETSGEPALYRAFPIGPVLGEYEEAKDKAYQLLKSVLPERSWLEMETKGKFKVIGQRGIYVISDKQTEICNIDTGQREASACLRLTVPAPDYDRMVTEYLLIKNDEDLYWQKANIFKYRIETSDIACFLLFILDFVLFMNIFVRIFVS